VDEAPLLDAARRGDLAAFNQLVHAYQGLVYNVCLRMLGQPGPAEDAAQEAFLAAWRNLGRLRGERFRPWLLRIAANACTDELRRRGRKGAASLDTALDAGLPHPEDPAPSPEAASLDAELRGRIESALRLLPSDQRLAVVLRDVQGLDYEEVASVMKTSLGTVKSRINRGRAKLRELLLAQPELLPARFRPRE
jgi:RNA polymerase sigma-70 factor (ECF subfamily)